MKIRRNGHFAMFGVAGLALLGAFVGQSILPGTPKVNAEEASSQVVVKVNPIIALSTSGTDAGTLNIRVTDEQMAAGDRMASGGVNVKVTTNDPSGYAVYINTQGTNASLTRTDGITAENIQPLTAATTSSAFPEGYWGYSTDGGSNYKPVPTSAGSHTVSTAAVTYDSAATEHSHTFTIGAKAKSTTPSGHYQNTIVFTAIPAMSLND